MEYIKAVGCTPVPGTAVQSMRCPTCQQRGTFEGVINQDLHINSDREPIRVGIRRCPNPECHAIVYIVVKNNTLSASYPPELIDFDASDVPQTVARALEEALKDHANECYISAAIMVRKTLELLCREFSASGDNLKARIKALASKALLPNDMFDGLDDLRLLGNDAAHIESKEYNQVGKEEVEVAIEFTKAVLRAAYQHKGLMAKLKALKK